MTQSRDINEIKNYNSYHKYKQTETSCDDVSL